ncbi:MAG TPA: hypothetical protein VFV22_01945 [Candidatus Paceibacterota bacterium]|nr:hypothetical protein [Candidatus Paceibacterota bacterium]
MLGKAKNFMMRKLLEKQLKDVPKDQQELIMTMVEKDPKLFEKIALEIQAEMKGGKDQMAAAMKVLPKYQAELQALMGDKMPQTQNRSATQFNPNGTIHR